MKSNDPKCSDAQPERPLRGSECVHQLDWRVRAVDCARLRTTAHDCARLRVCTFLCHFFLLVSLLFAEVLSAEVSTYNVRRQTAPPEPAPEGE